MEEYQFSYCFQKLLSSILSERQNITIVGRRRFLRECNFTDVIFLLLRHPVHQDHVKWNSLRVSLYGRKKTLLNKMKTVV